MTTITILIDGQKKVVNKAAYIRAKTRQLREFGYSSLTTQDVREQLDKHLAGEELDVIGMFLQDEVLKESE